MFSHVHKNNLGGLGKIDVVFLKGIGFRKASFAVVYLFLVVLGLFAYS